MRLRRGQRCATSARRFDRWFPSGLGQRRAYGADGRVLGPGRPELVGLVDWW